VLTCETQYVQGYKHTLLFDNRKTAESSPVQYCPLLLTPTCPLLTAISGDVGGLTAAAGAQHGSVVTHQELNLSASEAVTLGLLHSRTLVRAALETPGLHLPLAHEEIMRRLEEPHVHLQLGSGSTGIKGASLGAVTFLEGAHHLGGPAFPLIAVTGTVDLIRRVGRVGKIVPKLQSLEPMGQQENLIRSVLYPAANAEEVVAYFDENGLFVDERFHAVSSLEDVVRLAATIRWGIDKESPTMAAHSPRFVDKWMENWHDCYFTGKTRGISGKYHDKAVSVQSAFVPGTGRREITGLVGEPLKQKLFLLVDVFGKRYLSDLLPGVLRVRYDHVRCHFVDSRDRVLDLYIHIGDFDETKGCRSFCLPVLMSLIKAALGDAGCGKKGKALVCMADVDVLHRSVLGVEWEIPEGYLEPTNRVLDVILALDNEVADLPEGLAGESVKGVVVLLDRSGARVASGLGSREIARHIEVHGVVDLVRDVVRDMGYDPTLVLKEQAGSQQQVKTVVAAAAARLGNTVRLLYVSPAEAEARMPARTFEDLMGIKVALDKKDEECGPSSSTRGAKGEEPRWRQFDIHSDCADVSVFRPEVITQSILDFLGRDGRDNYGLGFGNGATADRDARPAPPAIEEAVRSACAPFREEDLKGLVPFSYTLARSSDDLHSAHEAHKDPPAYHGVMGMGMYGVVDMCLHHPSQGFAENMQRLEPYSDYLMKGQAAVFARHSVTAPLTAEGRCVFIVRFITKLLLERMMAAAAEAEEEEEEEEED